MSYTRMYHFFWEKLPFAAHIYVKRISGVGKYSISVSRYRLNFSWHRLLDNVVLGNIKFVSGLLHFREKLKYYLRLVTFQN